MTGGSPIYVRDSNSSRLVRVGDTRKQTSSGMSGGEQENSGEEGEGPFQVFSNSAQKEQSIILEIASVKQKLAEAWENAEQEKWQKKLQDLEDSLAKIKDKKNSPKEKKEDEESGTRDNKEAGGAEKNNLTFADDHIDFPWGDFSRDGTASDEETFRNVTDAVFVQVSDRVSLLKAADSQVKAILEYYNLVVVKKQEYVKEEYLVFKKAEKDFSKARAELAQILHKMLTYYEKLKQAQGLPAFSPDLQARVRQAAVEVKNTANPSESNLVHKVIAGDIKKHRLNGFPNRGRIASG